MKKEDLIELINMIPAGAEVRVTFNTHDYWRSVLAADIIDVQEEFVKHTDYHDADQILDPEKADTEDEKVKHVWVLTLDK